MANTNNSKKISQLPQTNTAAGTDRLLILKDPTGNVSARTINLNNLATNLALSANAPVTSTSNGIVGTLAYDQTYLYICTNKNVWKRVNLETW